MGGGGGGGGGGKSEKARRSSARVRLWVARASTVLLWTCLVQLAAYRELWAPSVLSRWPGCLNQPHVVQRPSERVADAGQTQAARALVVLPPKSKLVASWFMFFFCFWNQASLLPLVRNFLVLSFPFENFRCESFLPSYREEIIFSPQPPPSVNFELSNLSHFSCSVRIRCRLFLVQFNSVFALSSHRPIYLPA
jgi:hypothetical protein